MIWKTILVRLAALLPVILLSGCMATNLKVDNLTLRNALLDVYTDQVMDNLIRARTFQPFVQLAYRNILLQEANTYFGELTNAQTSGRHNRGQPSQTGDGVPDASPHQCAHGPRQRDAGGPDELLR